MDDDGTIFTCLSAAYLTESSDKFLAPQQTQSTFSKSQPSREDNQESKAGTSFATHRAGTSIAAHQLQPKFPQLQKYMRTWLFQHGRRRHHFHMSFCCVPFEHLRRSLQHHRTRGSRSSFEAVC